MPKPNLELAHKALQRIKSNSAILEQFDLALTSFRHRLAEDLDDETFTYVTNTLLNQRVKDGVDDFGTTAGVTRLPSGFRILAAIKV